MESTMYQYNQPEQWGEDPTLQESISWDNGLVSWTLGMCQEIVDKLKMIICIHLDSMTFIF